ncbi:hypothetical protein QN277_002218 [Acacia crassicarpa]|uniref:CYTH domain-containing protein n=1 Tax=Acacia crassicarpa TaxID=499986 RepID=A0AAE1TJA5_9FABA|nr:hypothetical protein QN277_002218 [Acacia crassicarpa]
MEVEVKLRLENAEALLIVTASLAPFHIITHRQENLFFDGAAEELLSRRAVLRLRFYDDDARCVVSLKAKAVLVNGVIRVEEDEGDLDPKVGRDCVVEPGKLDSIVESRVLRRMKEEFGVVGEKGYVGLGGFKNVRSVCEWKDLKLEVDETSFGFGTLYEIECESSAPEKAKQLLEKFLKENGFRRDFRLSSVSFRMNLYFNWCFQSPELICCPRVHFPPATCAFEIN